MHQGRQITADTNVLVRALVQDDPGQARAASALLEQAELVASASVRTDRPAVRAGLQLLAAGGDFADGVIAYGGRQLGGDQLATLSALEGSPLSRQERQPKPTSSANCM